MSDHMLKLTLNQGCRPYTQSQIYSEAKSRAHVGLQALALRAASVARASRCICACTYANGLTVHLCN